MDVYVVRTRDGKEMVGIFAAESMAWLTITVDEVTDPALCEYRKMPGGGIAWFDETEMTVPTTWPDSEDGSPHGDQYLKEVRFSEDWRGALREEGNWHRLMVFVDAVATIDGSLK